jgi:hypothetical protein
MVKTSNKPDLPVPLEIDSMTKGILFGLRLRVEEWLKKNVEVGDTLLGEIYLDLGAFGR